MIADDVSQAASEMSIYYRARTLCATAEPHTAERPCQHHRDEARRQLRPASAPASATGGSAAPGAGASGAACRSDLLADASAAAPPEKDNRPGSLTPEAAERAAATAQKQV